MPVLQNGIFGKLPVDLHLKLDSPRVDANVKLMILANLRDW